MPGWARSANVAPKSAGSNHFLGMGSGGLPARRSEHVGPPLGRPRRAWPNPGSLRLFGWPDLVLEARGCCGVTAFGEAVGADGPESCSAEGLAAVPGDLDAQLATPRARGGAIRQQVVSIVVCLHHVAELFEGHRNGLRAVAVDEAVAPVYLEHRCSVADPHGEDGVVRRIDGRFDRVVRDATSEVGASGEDHEGACPQLGARLLVLLAELLETFHDGSIEVSGGIGREELLHELLLGRLGCSLLGQVSDQAQLFPAIEGVDGHGLCLPDQLDEEGERRRELVSDRLVRGGAVVDEEERSVSLEELFVEQDLAGMGRRDQGVVLVDEEVFGLQARDWLSVFGDGQVRRDIARLLGEGGLRLHVDLRTRAAERKQAKAAEKCSSEEGLVWRTHPGGTHRHSGRGNTSPGAVSPGSRPGDPSRGGIGFGFMKVGRLAEISRVFVEEGLALAREGDDGSLGADAERGSHRWPENDIERAVRLRRALERLGPTFVKFGQLLATRLDLFSPEFVAELSKLRAHVAPFPTAQAREILREELGDGVLAELSDEPVASASIAQVYRARLTGSADWVAVKVARPGLRETLERDLEVIIDLSRLLDRLVPTYHRSMVHRVAVEYATRARLEADLLTEGRALEQFAEVVRTVKEFRIPRVYMEHSSSRVLVMEWLEGRMLDGIEGRAELEALGFSGHDLALAVLRLQLVMSYEFGFVHGDTHPGNLILLGASELGLIDFGLHGHVPRRLCDQMLELLFYQASGRTEQAAHAFERIFSGPGHIDRAEFLRVLEAALAEEPDSKRPLTGQLVRGLELGARYRLQAQSELFLVLRNLTIVEGIVMTYYPELDILAEAQRILSQIMVRRAAKGFGAGHLGQLGPLFLLNLSKRAELVDTLLRLERSLTDSADLGQFLEKEGVFTNHREVRSVSPALAVIIGCLAALVTALALRVVL